MFYSKIICAYILFQCKQLFSPKEMDRRLSSIRYHMEKDGIDACVFTSYYNLYYFSDFLYCSMGRQYAMIVTDEKAVTTLHVGSTRQSLSVQQSKLSKKILAKVLYIHILFHLQSTISQFCKITGRDTTCGLIGR